MTATRRLAAILAADVAGYSRLMGADEEGTLDRLKTHCRELVDPKIAEHRGRIVKTTGDSEGRPRPSRHVRGVLNYFPVLFVRHRRAFDWKTSIDERLG